jgi:MarR family transcriptional regulator, organic hydroperoxide resistance regulator
VGEFNLLFTRASKLMRSAADAAMGRLGVRLGQNLVIALLGDEDGLTPGEIASRLHVSTPTIVKMATRMEATGLLTRRRDPEDGRLVRLFLTDRGRSLIGPIEQELGRLEEIATADLTHDERRHLERALTKIVANLEGIAPPAEPVEDEVLSR